MKIQIVSEDLTNATKELRAISTALNAGAVPDFDLLRQITSRLADVEARIQKIESLIVTKTTAGKPKLTDEGQRVGALWYQKNQQ